MKHPSGEPEALGVLRLVEWVYGGNDYDDVTCSFCEETPERGHASRCLLGRALGRTPGEPADPEEVTRIFEERSDACRDPRVAAAVRKSIAEHEAKMALERGA